MDDEEEPATWRTWIVKKVGELDQLSRSNRRRIQQVEEDLPGTAQDDDDTSTWPGVAMSIDSRRAILWILLFVVFVAGLLLLSYYDVNFWGVPAQNVPILAPL